MVGAGREGQKRADAMIGWQRVRKVMDAVRCYQQPRGGAKPGRTTMMLATRVTYERTVSPGAVEDVSMTSAGRQSRNTYSS